MTSNLLPPVASFCVVFVKLTYENVGSEEYLFNLQNAITKFKTNN